MPEQLLASKGFSTEIAFRRNARFRHFHVLSQKAWHCELSLAFATDLLTVVLLCLVHSQFSHLWELLIALFTRKF